MVEIEFIAGMLEIRSIGFFGQFTRSPNGTLIISWGCLFQAAGKEGHVVMLRTGQQVSQRTIPRLGHLIAVGNSERKTLSSSSSGRESTDPRVVSIGDGELLWQTEIERPNDGNVADTGHAVINDWGSLGGCDGTFYAFGPDGTLLVKQQMRANMDKPGLTNDGTLAWCTTIYSNVEKYDSKLSVFSLSPPKMILNATRPPSEWKVASVRRVGTNTEVSTTGARYLYDLRGVLLNEDEVTHYHLEHGGIYKVLRIVERRIDECAPEKMSQREADFLLAQLERVSIAGDGSGNWRAKAQRRAGEIALARGDKERALTSFRRAIAFDPKIGVAKMIRKLERPAI